MQVTTCYTAVNAPQQRHYYVGSPTSLTEYSHPPIADHPPPAPCLHATSLCPTGGPTLTVHGSRRQGDPNNIDLHEGLAALCVDSGHPEEAAACYRRCLDLQAAEAEAAEAAAIAPSDIFPAHHHPSKGAPGVAATATAGAEAAAARIDRWSVALFKCNASLCQWDDWSAEALALRSALHRRRRRRRQEEAGKEEQGIRGGVRRGRGGGVGAKARPMPSSQRSGNNDKVDLVDMLLLGRDDDDIDTALDSWRPSRDKWQLQRYHGDGDDDNGVDGNINSDDVSRPALHPFDSLSAPLSIGDCLAVAQQHSRGVLVEASGGGDVVEAHGGEEKDEEVAKVQGGRRQLRRHASFSSSRDAKGRVRLGYVSGDLMGTHPLTHLMQAREREYPVHSCAV